MDFYDFPRADEKDIRLWWLDIQNLGQTR